MSSESLFVKCKTCGKAISKTEKVCPQCGGKQKKLTVFHWIGIVFGILIVIVVLSPSKTSKNGATATTTASEAVIQPPEQVKFIETVELFAKKFSEAKNELQQSMLKDERKTQLSLLQIDNSVTDWVGSISTLKTNTEGKAILSIRISPHVEIKTWNNALSDMNSYTLIDKDSDLYQRLLALSVGQQVKFSGSFFVSDADYFEETSVTIKGAMRNPEFLFKFSSIEAI